MPDELRILGFVDYQNDPYSDKLLPQSALPGDLRSLLKGHLIPVDHRIISNIAEAAAQGTSAVLPPDSVALDRNLLVPFHVLPVYKDAYDSNIAHLIWVANPKINFGVREETSVEEVPTVEINIDDLAPFSMADIESEGDSSESNQEPEESIQLAQFITRHRNDLIFATNEIGGLSKHETADLDGVCIMNWNNLIGFAVRYLLPRIQISQLFGIHSTERIVQTLAQRDLEYLHVDSRGMQLVTNVNKSSQNISADDLRLRHTNQPVIFPILLNADSERALGQIGFQQYTLGLIAPTRGLELEDLGINETLDISNIPLGPGFARYSLADRRVAHYICGAQLLSDPLTNVLGLANSTRILTGALVALPLEKQLF